MKLIIVLALVAAALGRPDETYEGKFENINVDEIISNPTLLKNYLNCLLGKGSCTPDGKQIKGHICHTYGLYNCLIPEGINTSCAKCTDKQKELVAKSILAAKEKFLKEYNELVAMHDPEGKHTAELEAFVTKYSS